jgi:hypothetical protein
MLQLCHRQKYFGNECFSIPKSAKALQGLGFGKGVKDLALEYFREGTC